MFNMDIYEIGEEFYAPSFGYPPQRIANYDVVMNGHITLNGLAGGGVQREFIAKTPAPQKNFTEETGYLRGLAANNGESVAVRKNRKFNRVFGY